MARNGAGIFAVLNPILIGALRSSTAVNQDFSDAGDEITDTLPLDGTVGMTGQFKAVDGVPTGPGITFASETRTGFRRNGLGEMRWVGGGSDRFYIDVTGKAWHLGDLDVAGAAVMHGALTGDVSDPILISQFAANGAAVRGGDEDWNPDPLTYMLAYLVNGGGGVIPAGIVCDLQAPCAGTISSGAIMGDQTGSVSVDIWKDTYANYPPTVADTIVGGNPLVVSAGVGLLDQTLSGWTKTVAAGDCFRFYINSNSSFTRLTIALAIKRFT